MPSPAESLLLRLGIDLSPAKAAGQELKAIFTQLNDLAKQAQAAGTQSLQQQKQLMQELKTAATAVIQADAVKSAHSKAETAELVKQAAAKRAAAADDLKNSSALLQAKKLEQQSVMDGLARELAQRKLNLAIEQEKLAVMRKQRLEERGGGHEGGHEAGILHEISTALTGRSGLANIGNALLLGGGLGAGLAAAKESLVGLVEQIREVTVEAGKLTQIQYVFEGLAKGSGVDATEMIKKMQEATEGLVDRQTLLRVGVAGLNSTLKLNHTQIEQSVGDIVKLAEAHGKTGADALQRYIRMLETGRINARALQLGITQAELKMQNLPASMTQLQRSAAETAHALDIIHSRAEAMGELPQTIEQAIVRLGVSWRDVLQSFGKGVNESAGTQTFVDLLHGLTNQESGSTSAVEQFGKTVGDVFLGIGVVVQQLADAVKNLFTAFSSLASGDSGTDAAAKSFEKLHPVLSTIMKDAIWLNLAFADLLKNIRSIGEAAGFGAILGGIAGFAAGGPAGIAPGMAWGARLSGGAEGLNLATGGAASSSAPLAQRFNGMNGLFSSAAGMALDILGVHRPGGTSQNEHVSAPKSLTDRMMDQYNELVTKYEEHAGQTIKGTHTDVNDAAKTSTLLKEIEARKRLEDSKIALDEAAAKATYAATQEEISNQKQLEEEAYKNAEISLQNHLTEMRRLEDQSYQTSVDNETSAYQAKMAKLQEDYDTEVAKSNVPGADTTGKNENLASLKNKALQTTIEYNATLLKLKANSLKAINALDQQSRADSIQTARVTQDTLLQIEADGIKQLEDMNHKYLASGAVSYASYLNTQRDLIRRQVVVEIAKLTEDYSTKPNSAANSAELQQKVSLAALGGIAKLADLDYGAGAGNIQDIQSRGNAQAGLFGGLAGYQKSSGQDSRQSTQLQLDAYRALRTELQANLETVRDQPVEWYKTFDAIVKVSGQIQQLNSELMTTVAATTTLGLGVGSAGSAVQSLARTKYGAGIASQLTAGAKSLSEGQGLGYVLAGGKASGERDASGNLVAPTNPNGSPLSATQKFVAQMGAAVSALDNFASSILNAKNALSGALGGAGGGAGLGQAVGAAGPLLGMSKSMSEAMPLVGAAVGAVLGAIVGGKQAKIQEQINSFNTQFKDIMHSFAENNNNLQATIDSLYGLLNAARAAQANSKKGSAAFQQTIDQYSSQITQLQTQQHNIIVDLQEQLAVLAQPQGIQSFLTSLDEILKKYQSFAGAAQDTYQLAQANKYLTSSLQAYSLQMSNQYNQDNETAIHDALSLNQLLYERQQIVNQLTTGVAGILGQGNLTRQQTTAQTKGQQIAVIEYQSQQQLDQINQQIALTQFKLQTEQTIFGLSTTKIGLEAQLLQLQEKQASQSLEGIVALQGLINALSTGDLSTTSPIAGLIASIPGIYNPSTGATALDNLDALSKLIAAAYSSRASIGYGQYAGQGLP